MKIESLIEYKDCLAGIVNTFRNAFALEGFTRKRVGPNLSTVVVHRDNPGSFKEIKSLISEIKDAEEKFKAVKDDIHSIPPTEYAEASRYLELYIRQIKDAYEELTNYGVQTTGQQIVEYRAVKENPEIITRYGIIQYSNLYDDKNLNINQINMAVCYALNQHIKTLTAIQPAEVEDNSMVDLPEGNISNRLVLLNELGILSFLKERYPELTSSTNLASLLVPIMGITENKQSFVATVKKLMGDENARAHPKNNKSIKYVNSIKTSLRMEVTPKRTQGKK